MFCKQYSFDDLVESQNLSFGSIFFEICPDFSKEFFRLQVGYYWEAEYYKL